MATNGQPSKEKNSKEKNSINKIYGQNEDILTEPGPKKRIIWEEQFEKFYNQYPKKVKKQNVKKWFKNNKPTNELFSTIMNSLEQFKGSEDWLKDNGQYIPYPTSWLNQKRWEDEVNTNQTEEIQRRGQKGKTIGVDTSNLTNKEYGALMRKEVTIEQLIKKGRVNVL